MYQWHQNPVSASCVWCGSVGFVWWWSPARSVCSRVSKSVNESGLKPWSSAGKGWSACCRSGTNWHRKCQSLSTFMRTRDWQMGWGCICSDVDAVLVHHRWVKADHKNEALNLHDKIRPYILLWSRAICSGRKNEATSSGNGLPPKSDWPLP